MPTQAELWKAFREHGGLLQSAGENYETHEPLWDCNVEWDEPQEDDGYLTSGTGRTPEHAMAAALGVEYEEAAHAATD
jgi:hypothetical protein